MVISLREIRKTPFSGGRSRIAPTSFIAKRSSLTFCKELLHFAAAPSFLVPLTGSRESRCRRRRDRRQADVPRTSAFGSFESGCSECRTGIPRMGYPCSGAADRTRTGTELPPADFKSAVSTIPPQRRILHYFSTGGQTRQVGNGTQAVPFLFISAARPETPRTSPGTRPGFHHYIMYGHTQSGTNLRFSGRGCGFGRILWKYCPAA